MKPVLLWIAMLLGGGIVGGGSAVLVASFGPAPQERAPLPSDEPPAFVPVDLLVPLVFEDGELAAYLTLRAQLQVAPDSVEEVTARVPLLQHAINLETYRTPFATGPDGRLPDLAGLRKLIQRSADRTLGGGVVTQVAIVEARS